MQAYLAFQTVPAVFKPHPLIGQQDTTRGHLGPLVRLPPPMLPVGVLPLPDRLSPPLPY